MVLSFWLLGGFVVAVSLTVIKVGAHIEPMRNPHRLAARAARAETPPRSEPRWRGRPQPRPSPTFIERHVNRCDSWSPCDCWLCNTKKLSEKELAAKPDSIKPAIPQRGRTSESPVCVCVVGGGVVVWCGVVWCGVVWCGVVWGGGGV